MYYNSNYTFETVIRKDGLGAVPVLPGVVKVVTAAVQVINKIGSFFKGRTQEKVLDEVGTLDGYILTRFSQVMSRSEIYDSIIDPWKRQFKLFSGDIPNIKLSGDYNKEMTRVAQYYASYILLFQPEILQAWEEGVKAGKTVGTSLLNANGFAYRKNVVPFSKEIAEKLILKAAEQNELLTQQADKIDSSSGGGGGAPLQAGFGIIGALVALSLAGGLWYAASQAEKKKKKAG